MKAKSGGFTYIGLLLFVAMTGATLGIAGELWSTQSQRDREVELLFVGDQIQTAIAQYYENYPGGQVARFPERMDDLLDDRRWPTRKRHLRKIFVDPMTGSTDWALISSPSGGIKGVHSLSPASPMKRTGFAFKQRHFSKAESYRDWRFEYVSSLDEEGAGESETDDVEADGS